MLRKKILIIDDEKELTDLVKFRLEANGYEVDIANNAKDGIKKATLGKPSLILLDITMPQIDGLEALRRLKSNPETMDIPVVMLTCQADSKYIFESENEGSRDYIIKPFEAKDLLESIKKYAI